MDEIRNAILEVLAEQHPATCRGLYYALVSRGVIDKTEVEYKSTVIRVTGEMRRAGELPYDWLADNTRWMRKPHTWSSMEQALRLTAQTYRRSVWDAQGEYVEIWLEKDALAGVIYDVTDEWDVPLMVTRGYASLTFLFSAAQTIKAVAKPTTIYYLGDHDPSGVDIPRKVESDLRRLAPRAELSFARLAVNPEQITTLNLPTRPTKKSDSRSRSFIGDSVEVDAISAPVLRRMVADAIESHVDPHTLAVTQAVEAAERATFTQMAGRFGGAT